MFSSSYSLANKTVPQNNDISLKLYWASFGCKNTLYILLQRKLGLKMAQYKGRNMSSA